MPGSNSRLRSKALAAIGESTTTIVEGRWIFQGSHRHGRGLRSDSHHGFRSFY